MNEPLLLTAAKAIAEERQHGCHYAEGACRECVALALAALSAVITERPNPNALGQMARAHSPRLWEKIDAMPEVSLGRHKRDLADNDLKAIRAAYRAMPVYRILYGNGA